MRRHVVRGGADLLCQTRHAARITQTELANRAGTKQSAIARLETGRVSPTIQTLTKLIAACGYELELSASPRKAA